MKTEYLLYQFWQWNTVSRIWTWNISSSLHQIQFCLSTVCSKERSRLAKFKPAVTMRVLQLDWSKLTSWKYCGNCCWKDNKRINCSFSEPFTFQSKCLMYFLFLSSLNSKIPLSITVHSSKVCHKKLIILHGKVLLCMRAGCCSLLASPEQFNT